MSPLLASRYRYNLVAVCIAGMLLLSLGPVRAAATDEITIRGRSSAELRRELVDRVLVAQGITDPVVLEAMRAVPRHVFVPAAVRDRSYENRPLPIGNEQTISQPFIVAYMTQTAGVRRGMRVLEIGTGSGYQAAILAQIGAEVYSIEIIEALGRQAEALLKAQGYTNIHVRIGDGYQGWSEHAPYDAILVTAAPSHVPQPLVDQLAVGGRMVIPVGTRRQQIKVITKTRDGVETRTLLRVRFVPMTGEAGTRDE